MVPTVPKSVIKSKRANSVLEPSLIRANSLPSNTAIGPNIPLKRIGRVRLTEVRREACTTEKVLSNVMKKLDGNIDDLDGIEELKYKSPPDLRGYLTIANREEDQKMVREALERGSSMSLPKLSSRTC